MKMKHPPQEWDLISNIQKIVQRNKAGTLIPLGDDGFAAEAPTHPVVLAQDMMIEGVHFDLQYSSPTDLGYKALAVNLSDLAAMGANPHWAQVSLGITRNQNKSWLDEFYTSMSSLADHYGMEIVGGDTCHSPHSLVIDVSVFGSSPKPISRHGAQTGDLLLCSGPLGLAAQGLQNLKERKSAPLSIQRQLRPNPRLDLLSSLQEHADKIHALIDVSDGLVSECLHLTRHLDLGLELWDKKILQHPEVEDKKLIYWGGEDYELLLAIAEADHALFKEWNVIGRFNSSEEIVICRENQSREVIQEFKGWRHF